MTGPWSAAANRWFRPLSALLLLVTTIAFAPALRGPLLYDDRGAIAGNPRIESLSPAVALHPPQDRSVSGRPVANYSLAVSHAINHAFGLNDRTEPFSANATVAYHALSLVLHLATGILLLLVVRRTLTSGRYGESWHGRADGVALAVAALWLLHPIQTAAVDYMAQRTEVLVSFWLMATLYASIRAWDARTPAAARGWCIAGTLACLLGMGSKEVMIGAPLLVLLYDRAFRLDSWREWRTTMPAERRWFHVALFATSGLLIALMLGAPRARSAGFHLGVTWYDYLNSQGWAIPHYLRLVAWPDALTFDYGPRPFARWVGVPGLVALSLTGAGVLWCWCNANRWGWLAFCGSWFFVVLAPSSSFVPIATEIAGDRRIYLAIAGVLTPMVIGVALLARRTHRERTAAVFAVGIAAALAVLTFERSHLFSSEEAVWLDAAMKRPDNFRAWTNLGGVQLSLPGRAADARANLQRAVDLHPMEVEPQYNLALADLQLQMPDEAEQLLRDLLIRAPADTMVNARLGKLLVDRGDFAGAVPLLDHLAGASPDGPVPMQLASVEMRAGQTDAAINTLTRIIARQPRNTEALRLLSTAYIDRLQPDSAIPYLMRALTVDPRSHATYSVLSMAYARLGQVNEAVRAAEQATESRISTGPICALVGQAMLVVKRIDLAGSYFECSLQLDSQNTDALVGLGTVKSLQGDKQMARTLFQQALVLDSTNSEARAGLSHLGTPR